LLPLFLFYKYINLKKNKILITGASGFIGRHVLNAIIQNPIYEVHCIIHQKSILESRGNLYFHYFDMLDFSQRANERLEELLKIIQPYSCMHLAWYTGHKDYLISELNKKWEKASIRLIELFYKSGGIRFISTGTCIEYDLNQEGLHCEELTPLYPQTLYAESKMNVLNFLKQLNTIHPINFLWARIYFVYGPGEQNTRLVPYIINSLQKNQYAEPNNGKAYRDYIYVKDLAKQLIALLESDALGIINTGSGKPTRVQDIFNTIGRISNKEQLIIQDYKNLPSEVPMIIAPDLTLFNLYVTQFNYMSLEEGLKETMNNYTT
jgi:nucleoside-diphosphate-sugar epimerase